MVARAANEVAKSPSFLTDDKQSLHFIMIDGILNFDDGIDATFKGNTVLTAFFKAVWHDRLDSGFELKKLAASPGKERIFVEFLRGREDAWTPEKQIAEHENAALGLKFVGKDVPGRHFIDPVYIWQALQEMGASPQNTNPELINRPTT